MPADVGFVLRSVVGLATGILYGVVGRLILHRDVRDEERLANKLFATWWFSLALLYLTATPWTIAGTLGYRDLAFSIAFLDALLILLCVALWGLMGFLVYLYRGSHSLLVPLGILYGGLAFVFLWLIAWLDPVGFKPGGSATELEYANELGASGSVVLGLVFSIPIFVAAFAYATLVFRVAQRAPRYRILMVAGAFMVQFGWSIVSAVLGLQRRFPDSTLLLIVQQAIAILVPVLVILAYRPPAWVRSRIESSGTGV